jgi:dTDP-4-dehydrorhamnose reductase
MKAIVTGMNGTVAPFVARRLEDGGHSVVPWERSVVPTDDVEAVRGFIRDEHPDWFFHIATGSPLWAEWIAGACAEQGVRFLFTGSVSVFSASQQGPFPVDAVPEPDDEYGRYKLEVEQRVRRVNPGALVARLGWQIGLAPGSNNMVDFLTRAVASDGKIEASRNWYPSCSFLPDTAEALVNLMERYPAGLYQLEGNPGLSFFEIVTHLNNLHGNMWQVVPAEAPVQNNLMMDERIDVMQVTHWFEKGARHG